VKKFFSSISNILLVGFVLYLLATRAPQWWALYKEQGETVQSFQVLNLSSQSVQALPPTGQKAVLIFWATWCGPCTVELDRIQKAIVEKDLSPENIYAISLQEDPQLVAAEVQRRGYTFQVFADPKGLSLKSVKVFGTPTIYYVTENQTIAKSSMGLSPLLIKTIKDFLIN
jgi:peroxiredoxin